MDLSPFVPEQRPMSPEEVRLLLSAFQRLHPQPDNLYSVASQAANTPEAGEDFRRAQSLTTRKLDN